MRKIMTNKVINIIRSIDNGAEKEYLKEFFRFIGCFLSDIALDPKEYRAWEQTLKPCNEENGVDIVLNYFGDDPYLLECRFRKIKRIYCYFSFQLHERYVYVSEHPLLNPGMLPRNIGSKAALRRTVLADLIHAIWREEPEARDSVLNIANIYTMNRSGDLFFFIQARRSLRFLKMGEVLDVPNARVKAVSFKPYIGRLLDGLWILWLQLEGLTDPYSRYARVKAGKMMRDVAMVLREEDQFFLKKITFNGIPLQVPTIEELVIKLQILIKAAPRFLSAQMYLAGLSRHISDGVQEVFLYQQMLQQVASEKRQYAFIWYRMGRYYEKKIGDIPSAIRYYRKTIEVDPQYYQALFKLGFYAATEGRFKEAELRLQQAIHAIFLGRSTEPDINGTYPNWLALSLKESQYMFKTYMMLAKVAINSEREYSAKGYIGKACIAATRFDEATLVNQAADPTEFDDFMAYHQMSEHVWAIWKVLEPWTEEIILDYFLRDIVREKLARWSGNSKNTGTVRRSSTISEIRRKKRMDVNR